MGRSGYRFRALTPRVFRRAEPFLGRFPLSNFSMGANWGRCRTRVLCAKAPKLSESRARAPWTDAGLGLRQRERSQKGLSANGPKRYSEPLGFEDKPCHEAGTSYGFSLPSRKCHTPRFLRARRFIAGRAEDSFDLGRPSGRALAALDLRALANRPCERGR